jgi:hypothetical protein
MKAVLQLLPDIFSANASVVALLMLNTCGDLSSSSSTFSGWRQRFPASHLGFPPEKGARQAGHVDAKKIRS